MPFFETERVGGSFTVHGGLLAQAGVDVYGGEEGDRHGEVLKTERVREHGPGEEVGVLEGQREPVAILTLDEVPNLVSPLTRKIKTAVQGTILTNRCCSPLPHRE